MKEVSKTVFQMIIGFELVLVTFFYLFGKNGLQAMRFADKINAQLIEEIKLLELDVTGLTRELEERQANPFYKESVARKELQMAYKDETVYLLPGSKHV